MSNEAKRGQQEPIRTERPQPGARLEVSRQMHAGKRAARCWEITLSDAADAALRVAAI